MKKQKGFTLLELLVTASITSLLMLAISSLFITFLATAYKSRISQNLRETGTNAMNQIISMIRNSGDITSTCDGSTSTNNIVIVGDDSLETTVEINNDRIASVSAENTLYLTGNTSSGSYVNNLVFTCNQTPEGRKYIGVSFTVYSGDSEATTSAKSTSLNFSSGVATRN